MSVASEISDHREREQIIVSREFGFFSNIYSVIGALDWCEETGAVPVVQFDSGVYLDQEIGPNWWEYFFEQTPLLRTSCRKLTNRDEASAFAAEMALRLISDRDRTAELIQKYFRIRPEITREADQFWSECRDSFVVGLHIRGTDKARSAKPVDIQKVIATINGITKGRAAESWKLFVATDENRLLQHMIEAFGSHVIYQPAIRSETGQPIHSHESKEQNCKSDARHAFRLGLEALRDAMLLSRCDVFVGCDSNLSFFAAALNPETPWIHLARSSLVLNPRIKKDLIAKERVIQGLIAASKVTRSQNRANRKRFFRRAIGRYYFRLLTAEIQRRISQRFHERER